MNLARLAKVLAGKVRGGEVLAPWPGGSLFRQLVHGQASTRRMESSFFPARRASMLFRDYGDFCER